jgi:hypothetical protein
VTKQDLGIHPGKLLNNRCNVSFGSLGAAYDTYDYALTPLVGHWGPYDPSKIHDMWVAGEDVDSMPLELCRVPYSHKEKFLWIFNGGDSSSGVQPGKLKGHNCYFEFNDKEITAGSMFEVYYDTPLPPPVIPKPAPVGPPIINTAVLRATFINNNKSAVDLYRGSGNPFPCATMDHRSHISPGQSIEDTVETGKSFQYWVMVPNPAGACGDYGSFRVLTMSLEQVGNKDDSAIITIPDNAPVGR